MKRRAESTDALCLPLAGALLVTALLTGCSATADVPIENRIVGADPGRGRAVVVRVGCGVCHTIPGIAEADGIVGPPLEGFGYRTLIGGVVPNRPERLAQWVRNAPGIAPDTGMPDLPLSEREARDVAAYLYTLR